MYSFSANMTVNDMNYLYQKISYLGLDINDFQYNIEDNSIFISIYDPNLTNLDENYLNDLFKTSVLNDNDLSEYIIEDYTSDYNLNEFEKNSLKKWFKEIKNNINFLILKKDNR